MIHLKVIDNRCVHHYHLCICDSSISHDCMIYWNNKQWNILNHKIVNDKYKLLHMALYVMAKYPNWDK